MQTLEQWLARSKSGRKPKKPIPKVTKKRAKANREYAVRRKAFLEARPYCEAIQKILFAGHQVLVDAGQTFPLRSEQVHHTTLRRSRDLNDENTWLAVAACSHRWIHQHPKEARELGLIV